MDEIKKLQSETKKLKILYVEDDADARLQIEEMLELLFDEIFIAKNGLEGVEVFREKQQQIDLVITDIQMPIMDGLEMSKKIKEISPFKHILILTAHNDINYFSKAIDVGVDGFVIKPISTDSFLKSIEKSCRLIKNQKLEEKYHQELKNQLAKRTDELEKSLITDEVTGLYNKSKLNIELGNDGDYSILLINIDNFDHVNSTYGYDVGDEFLRKVADFFSELKVEESELFRLASDEFVYLFRGGEREDIEEFAQMVIERFSSKEFVHQEIEVSMTCTIGIAKGSGKQSLVDAHIAMKEVREIGKNRYYFYSTNSNLQQKQKTNIEWMIKVRSALEKDMVTPYFQPIVNNKTGKIEKYECLARIIDANRIITPNHFIEPARLVGMLPNITKVMLDKCFLFFSEKDVEFSINISEHDLREGYLKNHLQNLIDRYSIEPKRVVLEILENISAQGSQEALEQLKGLKDMGIKIALDDFGSEKSNFFRLQELNVDYIKIDGLFIKNIHENDNSYRITKTIKQLADSMNAKAIAEFVHSKEVQDIVEKLEIEYSQGYYFGKPQEEIL